MLQLLAALGAVTNTGLGVGLAVSRGGLLGRMGLPPPAPFYADLLAVFLVGSGAGFALAAVDPQRHRGYLWIFGVGVKLVAAMLFARLWLLGLAGWLTGVSALAGGAAAPRAGANASLTGAAAGGSDVCLPPRPPTAPRTRNP